MVRGRFRNEADRLIAAVRELNIRWARRALSLWRGDRPATNPEDIYDGFEQILTRDTIFQTSEIRDADARTRIRHGLIDHYLQRKLMPHETEMQAWSRGAAAHVDGEKIYFGEVIPWCQKSSTLAQRQKLQQETGPLCKLLKPFAVNYWHVLLDNLTEELGFDNYIDYCSAKKGIDYHRLYRLAGQLLDQTHDFYKDAMEAWSRDRFDLPLENLSRFDAIYLLSLSQWDRLCPIASPEETLIFFQRWNMDLSGYPGLHLDIRPAAGKSAQAITVMVTIPDEVYILMRPEGGWIDVETLWHELGHGLSAVYTDPVLSAVSRELATAFNLSETYAFFLQRMALSKPVLTSVMGLPETTVETIGYYRQLKDLSVFRRYAAKFRCEYEMFANGNIEDGRPYADAMARHTGFYHQPESHLFDLVPEFYCADYLLGWLGEAVLNDYCVDRFGENGCLQPDMAEWLKAALWRQGNVADIHAFFAQNGIGELTAGPLLRRWQRFSAISPPENVES
ncbi:hypothetical protein DSCW_49580 [Desulfosarcina widdelii]|uniref:Peptidase M3A/M3B catalytic domain-containing protein n=1 Tax=Desulfosarcina widdelii TaxID=947919 RepID=A0A5K7ZCT5_9BACT|nr:hypothetical protein [Desulfosarcina widdelii]BBO77541.1 hypothetical protein DSCW_49580 [Desulfosarcina widdelii]